MLRPRIAESLIVVGEKDRLQGMALLNAVWAAMPQYPLDEAFEGNLPDELSSAYAGWLAQRSERSAATW